MLELTTPVNDLFRRDFDLADPTLIDPTVANAIEQGEFLTLTNGRLARVGANSVTMAWQVFTQKGDFSAQALGKICVLFLNDYEALTDIYADAGGGFTVNAYLTAKQITVDGVTRSGLTQAVIDVDHVYGICTGLPADNGGRIKFIKVSPFAWTT